MNHAFEGWMPVRWCSDSRELVWIWTGDLEFRDPFFMDTIAMAVRKPYAAVMQRRTQAVCDGGEVLPLAGLILHMSRCGSTLVAQTLAASDRLLVLSEPPAFDQALRGGATDEEIREIVRAMTLKRSPSQTRAVLKLDCWHSMVLPRIQQLFPGIPMVFVHRDPVEVLVSQYSRPSAWTVPGVLPPEWFGLSQDSVQCSREEYCARLVGAICSAVVPAVQHGEVIAVSYPRLPGEIFSSVLRTFSIVPECSHQDILRAASRRDAKSPRNEFAPDSAAKQRAATSDTRRLADKYISAFYAQLH